MFLDKFIYLKTTINLILLCSLTLNIFLSGTL